MTPSSEADAIAGGRGKWSQPGVPHKGWRNVAHEDLGAPDATCEMCETWSIRYVYVMEHDNYPTPLTVGCVCAGYMQDDLAAAQRVDRRMRARAGQRTRWKDRHWKTSAKGNETIVHDFYRYTIYRAGSAWRYTIASQLENLVEHSSARFPTSDEAKLAAFDRVTTLKNRP